MKNWRYLILSLVLSLFIHYYVTAVLMEIFGMGWYPIQFVVWCIELVVIYDALMFFTKNWNVKHRVMFFFVYYLFLIIALLIRYDQGISISRVLEKSIMVLGQSGSYSHLILDTLCLCHG